jgi:FtsH-binding integral membrane protein
VLGVLAATDALVRESGARGGDPKAFFITPLTDMLVFSALVAAAFYYRLNPTAHKRIIIAATVALMTAPIARWHFALVHRNLKHAELISYLFLLLLVLYDAWSIRKVHRATLWASLFLVFMQQISLHLGQTAAWHIFASWVQSVAT